MLRRLFIVTIAVLGLSLAGSASAATVTANYSFVSSAPGTVAAPNTSHWALQTPTITSNTAPITGSASITFDASGGAPVEGGTATLDSLSFVIDMGAAGYGGPILGLGGELTAALVSPVSTTWTSGTLAPMTATLHLGGTLTCDVINYAGCYFGFPAETSPDMDTTVLLGATADLSHFDTSIPLTFLSVPLFSGNAVLAAVPEPGTLALLGAGLAGLVAARRWRRR